MYTVIIDGKEEVLNRYNFIQKCFTLKCSGKEFTVKYPSGYVGHFKQTKK